MAGQPPSSYGKDIRIIHVYTQDGYSVSIVYDLTHTSHAHTYFSQFMVLHFDFSMLFCYRAAYGIPFRCAFSGVPPNMLWHFSNIAFV